MPGGFFQVNDEQRALRQMLAEAGRPVHANVVAALCLFVDVEAGLLTAEMLPRVTEGGAGYDTSSYALVAVAGAFDLPLRGLTLQPVPEDGGRALLQSLCDVTAGGLIGQFRKPAEPGHWMEMLDAVEDVDAALDSGMEFTGHVLARFPVIEPLNEPDLDLFLEAGHTVLACFSSDYDRAVVWRKLDQNDLLAPERAPGKLGRFTFIQGYTAFSFNRQVLARLDFCEPESLDGKVLTADKDSRGNHHYRLLEEVWGKEDLLPPTESGLAWTRQVVHFPSIEGIPELIYELGQTNLLGRKAVAEDARTLNHLHGALRELLTHPIRHVSLRAEPELLARLEQVL
ncbi:MAG: hypothetical protein HY319_30605 [Armatimonadetes bacterium]|nr:hypothetical protein [Armatimonadota bacterium]